MANCIHGFGPGECLICQTLEGKGQPATATKAKATAPAAGRSVLSRASVPAPPAAPRAVPAPRSGGGLGLRVVGFLIVAVVGLVGIWWAFHLVLAVLHLLEVVAAALVAGYFGWVLGVHHGRRLERKGR